MSYRNLKQSKLQSSEKSPKIKDNSLHKGKPKGEIAGWVSIQTIRDKYDPSHQVFVLIWDKELKIGEFETGAWDYAYTIEGVNIYDIKKAEKLPDFLDRLSLAIKKVSPEDKVNAYVLSVNSELPKSEIESIVTNWLQEEYRDVKLVSGVVKLSRVKSSKKIPIPAEAFDRMIERLKNKK